MAAFKKTLTDVNSEPNVVPMADIMLVLLITRDGKTFLGADLVTDDLVGKVQERIAAKADKTVYIKSDARAKFERVVAVVDEVRSAGVDQVGLITERVEEGQGATGVAGL
jgi:biopolymer transport protein ExbD/biopolymer transport protein TolR